MKHKKYRKRKIKKIFEKRNNYFKKLKEKRILELNKLHKYLRYLDKS